MAILYEMFDAKDFVYSDWVPETIALFLCHLLYYVCSSSIVS